MAKDLKMALNIKQKFWLQIFSMYKIIIRIFKLSKFHKYLLLTFKCYEGDWGWGGSWVDCKSRGTRHSFLGNGQVSLSILNKRKITKLEDLSQFCFKRNYQNQKICLWSDPFLDSFSSIEVLKQGCCVATNSFENISGHSIEGMEVLVGEQTLFSRHCERQDCYRSVSCDLVCTRP